MHCLQLANKQLTALTGICIQALNRSRIVGHKLVLVLSTVEECTIVKFKMACNQALTG